MSLSRLRLSNFRNLVDVDLEIPAGVSVYFGDNAQGKTALVEAVYILAIARSFRAENERELVNFGAARDGELTLVEGIVEDGDDPSGRQRVIIGYRVSASDTVSGPGYRVSKEIRVNRMRRTAGALVGLVHAVLFSALDIELVQGSALGPPPLPRYPPIPSRPTDYLKALQRYQQVLRQRNRLLRLRREGQGCAPDEMEFWDGELVKEGSWLTWRQARGDGRCWRPPASRHHRGPERTRRRNLRCATGPMFPLLPVALTGWRRTSGMRWSGRGGAREHATAATSGRAAP